MKVSPDTFLTRPGINLYERTAFEQMAENGKKRTYILPKNYNYLLSRNGAVIDAGKHLVESDAMPLMSHEDYFDSRFSQILSGMQAPQGSAQAKPEK
jgi:hypothetical protein